jgi:transposase
MCYRNTNNGRTYAEILSVFKIGKNKLTRWIRDYRETGTYSVKKREHYKKRKLNDEERVPILKRNQMLL